MLLIVHLLGTSLILGLLFIRHLLVISGILRLHTMQCSLAYEVLFSMNMVIGSCVLDELKPVLSIRGYYRYWTAGFMPLERDMVHMLSLIVNSGCCAPEWLADGI